MRFLFGPEHDGLHVDPALPGAYEWWYFDALSDDGNWALVVIYFLGSPMSPYYKAVVDGRNPDPRDWCGVFVSLHENRNGRWKERAYAYNLYRDGTFEGERRPKISIGWSKLRCDRFGKGNVWHLTLDERGLWRGHTLADLTFIASGPPLSLSPMGNDADDHTWVCAAPVCRATGTITLPNGETISFSGDGYHDHNFGRLPWSDIEVWYWGRAVMHPGPRSDAVVIGSDEEWEDFINKERTVTGMVTYYGVVTTTGKKEGMLLVLDDNFNTVIASSNYDFEEAGWGRNTYGMRFASSIGILKTREFGNETTVDADTESYVTSGLLMNSPFYIRKSVLVNLFSFNDEQSTFIEWHGFGISEVFRPSRLCGPIASRAMWSRIRRRR